VNNGLGLVSTDVNGILKLWAMKKETCVNTYDCHEQKLWAIDVRGS